MTRTTTPTVLGHRTAGGREDAARGHYGDIAEASASRTTRVACLMARASSIMASADIVQGHDGVRFSTCDKIVTTRWSSPNHRDIDPGVQVTA